jgi:hypothetical protein
LTTPGPDPTAATISIAQTLALLDGPFAGVAQGVEEGRYALWLGSGISRGRVPGLDGLIVGVLEFLRTRIDPKESDCPYRIALEKAVAIAELREGELQEIDFSQPVASWPPLAELVKALVSRYSQLLDIQVGSELPDHLVWDGVDVRSAYGAPTDPDSEHLAFAILTLEGVVTDAPTPNWDGLIERAIEELAGNAAGVVRVVVLPEDLRQAPRPLTLFKFHGCAVLAAADPDNYRDALVARRLSRRL